MRIGYACKTIGVPDTDQKSCLLKNANAVKLSELITHNLTSLENMIDYNRFNHIRLFRISSDIIPFGSSPEVSYPWRDVFAQRLLKIGQKIQNSSMRVSMHPGQYTVLNSTSAAVVAKSIADLAYHAGFLDSLGVNAENKIVLHIGGIYQDKQLAKERFVNHFSQLDVFLKQRIVLENDDKSYTIDDVLDIGSRLGVPVVFDNLHNALNGCDPGKSDAYWIGQCLKTWRSEDGPQKIHYSQQDPQKKTGSHSNTIRVNDFMEFYNSLEEKGMDVMLEVKDKNLSAVKCQNCIETDLKITALELEWSKYKYSVLEWSPADYRRIRQLLQDKNECPALSFYNILDTARQQPVRIGNALNAAQHVWGYFKESATQKEKADFLKHIQTCPKPDLAAEIPPKDLRQIKKHLYQLAVKYGQAYLLNSYYFVL